MPQKTSAPVRLTEKCSNALRHQRVVDVEVRGCVRTASLEDLDEEQCHRRKEDDLEDRIDSDEDGAVYR